MNTQSREEHGSDVDHPGSFLAGLLAGVLIGGLAGAGTMWLLAPQSGEKTRAEIQLRTQELGDQTAGTVEDAMGQARAKARQITESVQEQAGKLQQRGQDVLDEQEERVSTAVKAGKKAAKGSRGFLTLRCPI